MASKISIAELIPDFFHELVESKGAAFIKNAGEDAVRKVVVEILCGANLRASTEHLTRQRLGKLNAATLLVYLRGMQVAKDFSRQLPLLAASGILKRNCRTEKWLCQWMLGLTQKGFQNILRDDSTAVAQHAKTFARTLEILAKETTVNQGQMACRIKLGSEQEVAFDWHDILSLFCTIGSQTLAIRGSEKATYGKLFERLVLGSVLTVLGFEHSSPSRKKLSRVFWLSSRMGEREADATLLIRHGQAVRFDLGFIGRGNPEITKDKLSRFERDLELKQKRYHSDTIIIVDRVAPSSGLENQAKKAGATIIQMSMSHWPKQLAQVLAEKYKYRNRLERMPAHKLAGYFAKKLNRVNFQAFVSGLEDHCQTPRKPKKPN